MTWLLSKKFRFEAAHRLPHHDGKCRRLHGHSWEGIVWIEGDILQAIGAKQGMVMDYSDLKKPLNDLVDNYLDHYFLNESLNMENPTSENVARWIFEQLKGQLSGIVAVQVNETCTSQCVYFERPIERYEGIMGGTTR